mgnify:CR=1 FL=1
MVVLSVLMGWAASAGAQGIADRAVSPHTIFVGSAAEDYLRYLQTLGLASPNTLWSARPLTPEQVRRMAPADTGHPWSGTGELVATTRKVRGVVIEIAPARVLTWYSAAYPFGFNDGAVWVGRGLTASAEFGVALSAGPISATLAPTAFLAQNQPYPLMANGGTGDSTLNDPYFLGGVDNPQRFGRGAYGRFDLGQSTIRADLLGFTLGVSSANEWWGPMVDFPYILSNNAPGLPRFFAGSSRPWKVPFGRAHGRLIYGRAGPSPIGASTRAADARFVSGLIGVFQPNAFPGLEIGGARLLHAAWPDSGLSLFYFTHVLEGFLKKNIKKVFQPVTDEPNESADNQLASLFVRWSAPRSGFEMYAEFGREDHSWDSRDLIVEPDHSSTVGLGVRKAWISSVDAVDAIQLEGVSLLPNHLGRHRGEGSYYLHGNSAGGHTNVGQLMGAGIAASGAAGTSFHWSRVRPSGSAKVSMFRFVRIDEAPADVQYAVGYALTSRRSPRLTISGGVTAMYELNRHLARDVFNVQLRAGAEWRPQPGSGH